MTRTDQQPMLELTRVIRAPREQVFDAWVVPEVRRQWWGAAPGMFCDLADIDAREGGRYRINMKGDKDGTLHEYVCIGEFVTFERPTKLVFTWSWENYDEAEPGSAAVETQVTIEFHEVPEGTELRLTHERFANDMLRDEHLKGWTGCLDSLCRTLER